MNESIYFLKVLFIQLCFKIEANTISFMTNLYHESWINGGVNQINQSVNMVEFTSKGNKCKTTRFFFYCISFSSFYTMLQILYCIIFSKHWFRLLACTACVTVRKLSWLLILLSFFVFFCILLFTHFGGSEGEICFFLNSS